MRVRRTALRVYDSCLVVGRILRPFWGGGSIRPPRINSKPQRILAGGVTAPGLTVQEAVPAGRQPSAGSYSPPSARSAVLSAFGYYWNCSESGDYCWDCSCSSSSAESPKSGGSLLELLLPWVFSTPLQSLAITAGTAPVVVSPAGSLRSGGFRRSCSLVRVFSAPPQDRRLLELPAPCS